MIDGCLVGRLRLLPWPPLAQLFGGLWTWSEREPPGGGVQKERGQGPPARRQFPPALRKFRLAPARPQRVPGRFWLAAIVFGAGYFRWRLLPLPPPHSLGLPPPGNRCPAVRAAGRLSSPAGSQQRALR